jgi:predicted DCC family thiol-disulfide oxidoreductase YuxK
MKNNHYILIYDDKCPMCAAYTSLFVKCGILTNEGRKSFTNVDEALLQKTDAERSKNEIPLIDTATGNVYYGIDALLELLNTKLKGIKTIGKLPPIYFFLKKLYKFISYNRKVIVAVKCSNGQYDCSPAFNYKWRFTFLIAFLLLNTLALFPVQKYVLANSVFSSNTIFTIQVLHAALVGSNLLLALTLPKQKAFEYLGQINMLATITIISLAVLALINKYVFSNTAFNNSSLALLFIFIVWDYLRRMTYAGTLKIKYVTTVNIICISTFLALLLF